MPLFQKSVVEKYLNAQNKQTVLDKWHVYQSHFLNPTIQENIRNSKEEQYQGEFLIDLFVNVLGYTKNPTPNFNLTTEIKNEKDSKKADGGILKHDSNGINPIVIGVIELKGTNTTDLNKIEVQAFGYKNNQRDCVYVITSNFEKLRFYIDNAIENIEFNLFQLTEKDFALLYLCLAYENIATNIPKKIKEESVNQENQITKSLYKDYSVFKNALFHNLTELNPEYEPLELFKKSQKLIDRFLFLFFGEDRQLLPPNSVRLILDDWKDLQDRDEDIPLYNRYKKYFEYLNTGFKGKRYDVFAYNGGLFKPDTILDHIKIDNQLLYDHTLKLAKYDFASEVDVNILGHIFENSLNELDEMKAKLDDPMDLNPLKTLSKRKKDGVFYTPKYITKYIVENTVGKLCTEKKAALQFNEEEYTSDRKRTKATKQPLVDKLTQYRNWLLQITIIDPACGSGAFLNEALNFLIAEHTYIDELQAKLFGDAMVLSDVEKSILENNLFGVDLNEESVEIAKLSLWLRTAQPNRKLNDLNNNIKCGNSLIDDPEIAGDKAFNWHNEFPQIFKEKNKKAFHLVFTTHNSRVSQRMIDYNVKKGPSLELDLAEEIELTKIFKQIILENNYNCLAYNICKDHVHLVLVCEEDELSEFAKVLKGKSSYLFQSNGFKPIEIPLWCQKYFFAQLDELIWADVATKPGYTATDAYLDNAIAYVKTNRNKHNLPDSKELKSIISDFTVDLDVAFETEYKGGFDVVIGNPPYVNLEKVKDTSDALQKRGYHTYNKRGDLYCVFVEKGFDILKENGILSYIMPNKWLQAGYGKPLREYFLKYNLKTLIDFGDMQIFEGATTYPCIFISTKSNPEPIIKISTLKKEIADFAQNILINQENFKHSELSSDTWTVSSNREKDLLDKLKYNFKSLSEFVDGDAFYGIKFGLTEAFLITDEKRDELIKKDVNSSEIIGSILRGRNLKRYGNPNELDLDNIIVASFGSYKYLQNKYPAIYEHLIQFEDKLKLRGQCNGSKETDDKPFKGQHHWLELDNNPSAKYLELYNKPKIMYQAFQVKPCFIYDEQGLYCNNSMWIIPTDNKALLGILNSKMGWWLITKYCTQIQNGCQLIWKYFGQIPIANTSNDLQILVTTMLTNDIVLQENSQKFQRTIQRKFDLQDLPKKLQDWYNLTYSEFIKELAKKKVKLSLSDEAEWEDYFIQESKKALALKAEIESTDKAIDTMVYELYGLSEDEIKIIEES